MCQGVWLELKKDSYYVLKTKENGQPSGLVKTRLNFSFKNRIIIIIEVVRTGWAQSEAISDYWEAGQTP